MSSKLKITIRILKYLFVSLALLFLLIVGAINLPFVHTQITKKTNAILAKNSLPVHIGKITLLLNGKIGISELAMVLPPNDTIIYAGKISINVSPLPLISNKIVINQITLANAVVNILTDSVTGNLQLISAINTSGKKSAKTGNDTIKTGKSWEIEAGSVRLKNIRFLYSDPAGGILVKESLASAEIDFDTFSILKKQIDIESLEIEKPVGMVGIWEGNKITEEKNSSTPEWKFSAKNLEIADLIFSLDQPDIGQRIDVALKKGSISLEKLDLATREILVGNIELNTPKVNFVSSQVSASNDTTVIPAEPSLPDFPWLIFAESIQVQEGFFNSIDSELLQTQDAGKWLPVRNLNASFGNTRLSPAGYSLNLEKMSLSLSNKLKIQSASLQLNTDSLQNIGLKIDMAALLNNDKKGWFAKDSILSFTAVLEGSSKLLKIEKMNLNSSSGLSFTVDGTISQLMKIPQSECDINFSSGNVTRKQLIPIVAHFSPKTILPRFRPFSVSGSITNSLAFPELKVKVNSGSGNIMASARYDTQNTKGELDASFTEILLSELLGETYPEKFTGNLQLNGSINPSNQSEGEAFIEIDSIIYKNKNTRNLAFHALAQNNLVTYNLTAADSALNCDFEGSFGWNDHKEYNGDLKGQIDVDLYAMNLNTQPLAGTFQIDAIFDFSPGIINSSVNIDDFAIHNKKDAVSIEKTEFQINTTDSIIESHLESDFITMNFKSRASFTDLKNALDSKELRKAINLDSINFINLSALSDLDFFSFDATVRYDSVFHLFYPDSVLNFSDINLNIQKTDINEQAKASLSTKWISYNKIKSYTPELLAQIEPEHLIFQLKTDSIISGDIKFGKSSLYLNGIPASITVDFEVFNINDSILHQIGFQAKRENNEVIFTSSTPAWLINQIPWTLSPPQFLTFDKSEKSYNASLDMNSGNKRLWLKGNSSGTFELDLKNIELKNVAFAELIGIVPEGTINGNIKFTHNRGDNLELNMEIQKMKWNNIYFNLLTAKGQLLSDSTGIPSSELLINADDSVSLLVEMNSNKTNKEYQVKSKFNKLQFQLFEPFIREYASNLHGTSSGEITLGSKNNKTSLNGLIRFNEFGLKIVPLQAWLTIPNNKIEINENKFLFNDFTVIDSLKRPLTVNGKIDFVNNEDIRVDLEVNADKISLMNTSASTKTPLYGSMIVNSRLSIGGSIYSPTIKGNIDLESGTNLTYQLLQDLSVKGSQTDVVFASITDSLQIIYPESEKVTKVTKMPNIETTININPKSVFNVKINDLHNVDIKIAGDGRLNYIMLPNNTMSLNGNYQIKTGDCKLKITGWPLKDFNITPGSSFSWNGSIENPILNLEATTKVRGSYVNPIDKKSRVVDFVVSMQLKNQLSQLDIVFELQSADQYITSVISSLSSDEMIRQAINLLLFETIEIPGIESSSNYLSSQINSFWESQLNSLTSTKLNKTKLSFGIDSYNQSTASGGQQEKTSFTYEMERKFMNDRATFKVSGKLNDYNEGSYQTNSLFENFIFEYSLDSLDTKNIKLYQKRDYEDMLEGEVVKYGAGFLYRKNYKKMRDIWRRKKMPELEEQKKDNN